jgi:hypothetical protein
MSGLRFYEEYLNIFFLSFFVVLGFELMALHFPGRNSTTSHELES